MNNKETRFLVFILVNVFGQDRELLNQFSHDDLLNIAANFMSKSPEVDLKSLGILYAKLRVIGIENP